MPTEKKKAIVEEIKKKIDGKNMFLADYRGLTVSELKELRGKLRPLSVDFNIVKNSLMKIAVSDLGLENLKEYLEGPTAIAVGDEDPVQTSKALSDYAKANKNLELKGGFLEGKIVSIEQIKVLASLPSREILLATLFGTINAPVSSFVRIMAAPLQSFATVLSRIKEQKEAAA